MANVRRFGKILLDRVQEEPNNRLEAGTAAELIQKLGAGINRSQLEELLGKLKQRRAIRSFCLKPGSVHIQT